MSLRQQARTVAGVLTIVTLLGLVAADVVHSSVTLTVENKLFLATLASGLLGVDLLRQNRGTAIQRDAPERSQDDR